MVIDGEVIWTTPDHPFYLGNDQWIQAGNLQKGGLIRNADWQVGMVDEVVTVYQTKPMYNLTVDIAHTYFVGEQQWLVHNTKICSGQVIHQSTTRKGVLKVERLFDNRSDAMNWAREQLGPSAERIYAQDGKWIGWQNVDGDSVYWGHGDWGQGLGKSTFPHLNYQIGGVQGHLYLRDKITNRGEWEDFADFFQLSE